MDTHVERLKELYQAVFGHIDEEYIDRAGKLFSRQGLDLRRRLLCAISALTTSDQPEHLRFFLQWAFHEKLNLPEIYEVILQSYLFAGYPAAIEGCFALRDILQEKGMSLEAGEVEYQVDEWRERGQKLCRQVYGKHFDQVQQNIGVISPELGEWMIVEGYGKVLSRPQLGAVERELCTVAALTVMGRKRQLLSHIKGAFNAGAKKIEVEEAIFQTSLFAGRLATLKGLELLQHC